MMKRRTRVYVMGPLNTGCTTMNLHAAFEVVVQLMAAGYEWFLPHLNLFFEAHYPLSYEQAMSHDLHWLRLCDVGVRISGASRGTDEEAADCKVLGKPVYNSVAELIAAMPTEIDDA